MRCSIRRRISELDAAPVDTASPVMAPSVLSSAGRRVCEIASVAKIRPPTKAVIARCGQPPTRRVHCISSAGALPRMCVCTGASQAKRWSM